MRAYLGPWRACLTCIGLIGVISAVPRVHAGTVERNPQSRSGGSLYEASCAACHGPDGRGRPNSELGFDTPVPDFTECSFATAEADIDWFAVAHQGGTVRAFDRMMPAFGDALSGQELHRIIRHIRTFCSDKSWPRGELNLPRSLLTEKAFPENETVLTATLADGSAGATLLYEQRFGARNQFEVAVPVDLGQAGAAGWTAGLGDVAVALKRVLFHSAGTILSAAGELILPTGNEQRGFGGGTMIFEPYLALGQVLPFDNFVQAQAGLEQPFNGARGEVFLKVSYGATFTQGNFGRSWTPIIELAAARELGKGGTINWDAVPQLQVSLSKRQHILLNAGVRMPVNHRDGRGSTLMAYLLWDWFDGGFFDGWR